VYVVWWLSIKVVTYWLLFESHGGSFASKLEQVVICLCSGQLSLLPLAGWKMSRSSSLLAVWCGLSAVNWDGGMSACCTRATHKKKLALAWFAKLVFEHLRYWTSIYFFCCVILLPWDVRPSVCS